MAIELERQKTPQTLSGRMLSFTDPFEGYFQEEMEDVGAGVTALWRLLSASRQHLLSFLSVEDQLSDVSQRIFLVNVV